MKIFYMLTVAAVLILQGCAHSSAVTRVTGQNLTLPKIEEVALGSSQQMLADAFGKPRYVAGPYPDQNIVEWFYGEGHYSRAGFLMDGASKRIFSKVWNVMDGDVERGLSVVIARYPGAHFTKKDSKFINPHKGRPTEVWYEDPTQGLFIEVKKATNEVESIVWCSINVVQTAATCFKSRMDQDSR